MLIEFTVGNYLSFKEKATISLLATRKGELRESNIIPDVKKGVSLLRSAVVYGANASGKSNLFSAIKFMTGFINDSYKESQAGQTIKVYPYLLDLDSKEKPSFFELVFIIDKIIYRYGFEATHEEVTSEWLFIQKGNEEKNVFVREKESVDVKYKTLENEIKGVPVKLRKNGLYLSALSMYGINFGAKIVEWIGGKFIVFNLRKRPVMNMLKGETVIKKSQLLAFLKAADMNIIDFEENGEGDFDLIYKVYDSDNAEVGRQKMSLENAESHGTQTLFVLSFVVIYALQQGSILLIDELEEGLHCNITRYILDAFNSKELNKNGAQLITNTHDVTLLNNKILRRDQIWFAKKSRYGSSKLLSLVEYNEIRSDEAYGKNYLAGKYGGIPYVRPEILLSALK